MSVDISLETLVEDHLLLIWYLRSPVFNSAKPNPQRVLVPLVKNLMNLIHPFPPVRKERSGSPPETIQDNSSPPKSPIKNLDEEEEDEGNDQDSDEEVSSGEDFQKLR